MGKMINLIAATTVITLLSAPVKAQSRNGRHGQSTDQQASGKKTYTDDEIKKIMDKNSYPDYDSDKATVTVIYALYQPINNRHTKSERLENLSWSRKEVEDIGTKYAEYWSVYNEQMHQYEPMEALWNQLKSTPSRSKTNKFYGSHTFIDQFESEVVERSGRLGNPVYTVPKMLNDVEEKAKGNNAILEKDDFKSANYQDKQKQVNSAWTSVELDMEDIDYDIGLAKYKLGDDNSDLKDLYKKRDETAANIATYKKDFDSKFLSACMADLAKIKPPAEVYAGADKQKFKKAIYEEWARVFYKEDTIVKIIFNGGKWSLDNRREYRDASFDGSVISATDKSNSYLDVTIIYKDPKDQAGILNMWKGYIDKDNKDGSYTYHICPEGGYLPDKILAKNVK
jgi:hypothetical protein